MSRDRSRAADALQTALLAACVVLGAATLLNMVSLGDTVVGYGPAIEELIDDQADELTASWVDVSGVRHTVTMTRAPAQAHVIFERDFDAAVARRQEKHPPAE